MLELDAIDYEETSVDDYLIRNLKDMELFPKLTTTNDSYIPPSDMDINQKKKNK